MFVLSPGSTKRNGVVFISAHPLSLFCPLSSISRCSPPVPSAYRRLCLAFLLLPCFHSTSKSIRLPAKLSLSLSLSLFAVTPCLPPLLATLSSLDALSRTTYMATRSSPPRDFDSCLIHVARPFTCVRGFPRPLFDGRTLRQLRHPVSRRPAKRKRAERILGTTSRDEFSIFSSRRDFCLASPWRS